MEFAHEPVMRDRVVEILTGVPQRWIVDGTVGLGGHAEALLERFPTARLLGLDVDPQALERAARRLRRFGERVTLERASWTTLPQQLAAWGAPAVTGVVLDLGVSSLQIDDPQRGFSYLRDGPLDMRMDPGQTRTAADLINAAPEADIARVLREYGEERLARRIAREIVRQREKRPLQTTSELATVVRKCVSGRKPVSTLARVFQGVRMWTNGELENLREGLGFVLGVLAPGSIFAVLSYHSLEDRTVKQFFRRQVDGCVCPPDLPACGCGFVAGFELVARRPLRPTPDEVARNPRARSARLRALRRPA